MVLSLNFNLIDYVAVCLIFRAPQNLIADGVKVILRIKRVFVYKILLEKIDLALGRIDFKIR